MKYRFRLCTRRGVQRGISRPENQFLGACTCPLGKPKHRMGPGMLAQYAVMLKRPLGHVFLSESAISPAVVFGRVADGLRYRAMPLRRNTTGWYLLTNGVKPTLQGRPTFVDN